MDRRPSLRTLVIGALCALTFVAACGGDDDDATPTATAPLEYRLASINAGALVADDDATIAEFGALLDELETYCPDSRQDVADLGVSSNELISERGGTETLMQTMQTVTQLLREGTAIVEDDSCTSAFALWVIAATEG